MRRFAFLLLFLLSACATARVEDLSLDEKIGQMFVVAAHGRFMNEDSATYQDLQRHVRDNHVGGLIWYASNVHDTAWITRKLQALAPIPLFVSADLEAGIGMRFADTTYWPPAMAVAATGDVALAETAGRITAMEARAIGINYIFAPVADVNVNADNPVINTRSFGEDPETVGRFVAAFVRGVQSQPMLATAKHFPGHGDTRVDTHRSLPVLDVDRARLDRVELVPFRAAIDANVASVMIGHLGIPALDATPAPVRPPDEAAAENIYTQDATETTRAGVVPASLSPRVITDLLRRDLGFKGLVIGDAFDMGGLVAHYAAGEAAVRAIEAGMDIVLKSADTDAAITAVKDAVRSGRIPEARIDESVRRILLAKRNLDKQPAPPDVIFRSVDTAEHRRIAADIASRAITLVREEQGVLPLSKDARVVIVTISDLVEVRNPAALVQEQIARRATQKPVAFQLDGNSRIEDTDAIIAAANNADVVLLALAVRAVSGAGHLRLPDAAHELMKRLPPNVKTVAVSFGSPYVLRDLPTLQTYLCAYGVQPVMQTAAVRALYGEAAMTGRLPVTIPLPH